MDEHLAALPLAAAHPEQVTFLAKMWPEPNRDAEIVMAEALGKQAETISAQADQIVLLSQMVAKLNG